MRKEQVIDGMPLEKRIPLEYIPAVSSIVTQIGRNRTKKVHGLILTFPQALCKTKASDLEC